MLLQVEWIEGGQRLVHLGVEAKGKEASFDELRELQPSFLCRGRRRFPLRSSFERRPSPNLRALWVLPPSPTPCTLHLLRSASPPVLIFSQSLL